MSKRTISIDPQFFNISKKKKKIIPSEVNINATNIRQLLLDKLREHKKTRKIETSLKTPIVNTPLQNKTFDESSKETDKTQSIEPIEPIEPIESKIENIPIESTDKPYGNLKNGTKPTYKQMYNDTQKNLTSSHISSKIESDADKFVSNHFDINEPIKEIKEIKEIKPIILEEKEVKKTFKLGKMDKKISVLIKNNKTRRKIEDIKTEYKKKNLATIKNYLKEKNLIKFGSTAPSKLLREMFETSELCGGISNENKDVLLHNFDK
jgi:hypothetical protein